MSRQSLIRYLDCLVCYPLCYRTLEKLVVDEETGWHKSSVAYTSSGPRRFNQPFTPTTYGPPFVQGDVIGCGYRPRTGTLFFTRNGKKLEDVTHGLKTQNFFPTVGANGPCTVHVNFGQLGFVFIEANVKKWGLAPMTGSLAPPPPYGSESGSILLEAGRESARGGREDGPQSRTRSGTGRMLRPPPHSPGPVRSPTDISLAHLAHIPSHEDAGEGTSGAMSAEAGQGQTTVEVPQHSPPEYTSPEGSRRSSEGSEDDDSDGRPLMRDHERGGNGNGPPIPSYEAAMGDQLR